MSRLPASSLTELVFAFMLGALALGALIETAGFLARRVARLFKRRSMSRDVGGDWWPCFEREFRTFTGDAGERPRDAGRRPGEG